MNSKFTISSKEIKKAALYCVEILILTGIGQLLGMFICSVVFDGLLQLMHSPLLNNPCYQTFNEYFYFIGVWIVFIACYSTRKLEKSVINVLGRKCRGNRFICFLAGLLIGFAANFLCGVMAVKHGDIALQFNRFSPLGTLAVFLAVMVQSGAEEVLCRGLLYQKLVRRYGVGLKPIVISSLLFAGLHLFNEGLTVISVINLFMAGIVPALMIYYFDSLWMCIAEHTAWNFTQSILLGLPNSGIRVPYSIFTLSSKTVKDSFFYNAGFGIEGSAFSLIVLFVIIAAMVLLMKNRRKPGYDVWQGITEAEVEAAEQEKSDADTLKQVQKYTSKDYRKKCRKDPHYTYAQLLDYELDREVKSRKKMYPIMIVMVILTIVLYVFVLPEVDRRQMYATLFGELIAIVFILPLGRTFSVRREELLKKYLGEKIAAEANPADTNEAL